MSIIKSIKQQLGLGPAAENHFFDGSVPNQLSLKRVRELLNYDPETGVFVCIADRHTNKVFGNIAGSINNKGYRVIKIDGKAYKAHRLAFLWMTGEFPKEQVDHINRDKSDNRWINLREATNGENQRNVERRGISIHHGKFRAQIRTNGKRITIGRFETEQEALAAYASAKAFYHNEFVGGVQ